MKHASRILFYSVVDLDVLFFFVVSVFHFLPSYLSHFNVLQ